MINIVIDTLGADAGLEPIVTGVACALQEGLEFFPVLAGPSQEIQRILTQHNIAPAQYAIVDACEFVSNEDAPTCVFGGKDETSMVKAYGYLKANEDCAAMLSAGNTGALLVGSICRLGLLPGLKFPALLSALPCNGENLLCLVDCGQGRAADLPREVAKRGHQKLLKGTAAPAGPNLPETQGLLPAAQHTYSSTHRTHAKHQLHTTSRSCRYPPTHQHTWHPPPAKCKRSTQVEHTHHPSILHTTHILK